VRPEVVLKFAICFALIAITFAVFEQTLGHEFVNYDDPIYVSENPRIHEGLNGQSVAWAFTHSHSHNWHPLTTMSHMLDWQMFGAKAGLHHLLNVFLHCANAVLLFLLLQQLTGSMWRSAFVAGVFAIHPLHVESVAWVAERKDVLSGFFFFLTLIAYVAYARKPNIGRYLMMSILFACGLMSKPMLVTLPAILLLLDYWPLNRFEKLSATKLVIEKVPLLILSIGSAVATLIAQRGDIVQISHLPLSWRATNALSVYLIYVWQMIWPAKLATIYPHPGRLPIWEAVGAAALLGLMTIAVVVLRKRRPYLVTGWFWYLVMLVPVIGLVQVGSQAHADRYTYLPQIGLYIAITWAVVGSFPYRREVLAAAGSIVIALFAWRAAIQTSYWHDTERLWNRTFAVTGRNDIVHFNYGQFLLKTHRLDEAISQFEIVLATHPSDPDLNFQLGYLFFLKKDFDLAIQHNAMALKMKPADPEIETNLANALLENGRGEEAIEHYRSVLQNRPSSARVHYNLAIALHRLGHLPEAIIHYKETLAIDRDYPDADYHLSEALLQNGQSDEAKAHLGRHYDFFPKSEFDLSSQHRESVSKGEGSEEETDLANTLLENGRGEEAVEHYRNVVRQQPNSALAHYNLAVGLHRLGHLSEAIAHYREALRIDPNYPDAAQFLSDAVRQSGQPEKQ
jgi:protein O-mannosyl-transferase